MYQSNSCIKHFFFSFPSDFFIYQLDFFVFDLLEPWILRYFAFWVPICFGSFCFLYFRIQWMLLTMNKVKFSLLENWNAAMGYAVYKIEFTSWKTSCLVVYSPTSANIISPEAHVMPCLHAQNFKFKINIVHVTFLQYVWIKPNWSILTNVENLTSNFGQSVQIYCREKEQEVGDDLSACVLNLLL